MINILKTNQERIGQYSTKTRASKRARKLIQSTGISHRIQLTTTYRDLIPTACWTVIMGIPGRGDMFQG